MQPFPNEPGRNQTPLYIRWGPDGTRYAIELKLELVGKIRKVLEEPINKRVELGGVLVGSLPSSYSPTIRVEDVEFISRDEKDGPTFMVDPRQENKVGDLRRRARETGRSVVGLFRTHLRPGALRPSFADRGLIASLFSEAVCALLLIEPNEPFSAALFIAKDRQLPADPSIREFRFDEQEFKQLPELEPEAPPLTRQKSEPPKPKRVKYAGAAASVAIGLIALWFLLSVLPKIAYFLGSDQLDVVASREGPGLRITWNHSSREFDRASGAVFKIKAGSQIRDIRIGPDELRLGALEIENDAPRVDVTMALEAPGSAPVSQSVTWGAQ